MTEHDLVERALAELPAIEVDELHGERVRRLARRVLQERRAGRWRTIEPVLAYAVGAAYLLWAIQAIVG